MTRLANLIGRLGRDERGGEVLEYSLIIGIFVVAALAVLGSISTKIVNTFSALRDGL
jgi:Flp pilus assembly pilin Flp